MLSGYRLITLTETKGIDEKIWVCAYAGSLSLPCAIPTLLDFCDRLFDLPTLMCVDEIARNCESPGDAKIPYENPCVEQECFWEPKLKQYLDAMV